MRLNLSLENYVKILLLIITGALLQVHIVSSLWFLGIKPDIFLTAAMVFAMKRGVFLEIIVFSASCGLLKDIIGLRLFGYNCVMFCVSAAGVYFLSRYVYQKKQWLKFAILTVVTFLYYMVLTIGLQKPYILLSIPEAFLNCLFLPLVEFLYTAIQSFPMKANSSYAHR